MTPPPPASPRTVVFFDHTAELGGGELALLNLLTHLDTARYKPVVVLGADGPLRAKLEGAGIETHVFSIASEVGQTRKDALGGSSLLKLKAALQIALYCRRLAKFLRRRRAHLLYTNSLKADIIGGVAGRLARVPVIWHVRDRIADDYLPGKVVRLFRWLARKLPQAVVANSQGTLETIQLPPEKPTRVIYSGCVVDDTTLQQPPIEELQRRITEERAPHIGIVGRISRWKGQHIFLQAAATIRRQYPNARFSIIGAPLFGEEEYEAEVHRLCTELGLDDCVQWLGFRHDVPQLVQELDVLVHASIVGEPFGNVIIEGMIAGKPVVATDGGGVPEIVVPGVTGHLVPMDDAPALATSVLDLLANPRQMLEMGRAGHQRVLDLFTIQISVKNFEAIIDRVLNNCSVPNEPRALGAC